MRMARCHLVHPSIPQRISILREGTSLALTTGAAAATDGKWEWEWTVNGHSSRVRRFGIIQSSSGRTSARRKRRSLWGRRLRGRGRFSPPRFRRHRHRRRSRRVNRMNCFIPFSAPRLSFAPPPLPPTSSFRFPPNSDANRPSSSDWPTGRGRRPPSFRLYEH